MQHPVDTPRPVRNAKAIANIKLLRHNPARAVPHKQPAAQDADAHITPASNQGPSKTKEISVTASHSTTMAGVSTQTDPIQVQEVPAQGQQPHQLHVPRPGLPDPPHQPGNQGMADMRVLIKDLTERMDRAEVSRQKSRSRSTSPKRRRRRSSSRDRRYSPTSERGSTRARRTSTGRRRSSSRTTSRRRSHSPRRRSRTRSTSRHRHSSSRSSSVRQTLPTAQTSSVQSEIDKALAAQYPQLGIHAGKRLPITGLTLEPYRSLPPDLRKQARERRSRRELTFPEHMCGLIKMISKALDPSSEAHAALTHAAQVAQDAATLPWPAVREWTQACMAHIEDRQATWHDAPLFATERTSLSWIKGRQMEAERRYPCPLYNKGKCDHKNTHAQEGTTWVHACALCLYMTGLEKTTHGASTCRQKNQNRSYEDHRQDNRSRGNQNRQKRDKQDNYTKN